MADLNVNASVDSIRAALFELRDPAYAAFTAKLIPTIAEDRIIGVRIPRLRALAGTLSGTPEAETFLAALPHAYLEENHLHAFLLERVSDVDRLFAELELFLPFLDNWATTDQLSPKRLKKHRPRLRAACERWLASDHAYTVRFGIGMLMSHFLDEDFDRALPALVASVRFDDYYVRMMVAWYVATALAKQYEAALALLLDGRLDVWTHNKAIQKAVESRRISEETKAYLKTLRRRGG